MCNIMQPPYYFQYEVLSKWCVGAKYVFLRTSYPASLSGVSHADCRSFETPSHSDARRPLCDYDGYNMPIISGAVDILGV